MKRKTLIHLISLMCLVTGFWATSIDTAEAVPFTPPPDNAAPNQGSGGATRN